eukprot:1156227-Pleurochrysis_carterae.AAC.1
MRATLDHRLCFHARAHASSDHLRAVWILRERYHRLARRVCFPDVRVLSCAAHVPVMVCARARPARARALAP